MPDMLKSAWEFSVQSGEIVFSLLDQYNKYYILCCQANSKQAHLTYLRPLLSTLTIQYNMVRPLIPKKKRYDKEIDVLKIKMEKYLSLLAENRVKPNYQILDEFSRIQRKTLDNMQFFGLLFSVRRMYNRNEQIREAYGTRKYKSIFNRPKGSE